MMPPAKTTENVPVEQPTSAGMVGHVAGSKGKSQKKKPGAKSRKRKHSVDDLEYELVREKSSAKENDPKSKECELDEYLGDTFSEDDIRDFHQFMLLKHVENDEFATKLAPTGPIDAVWHAAILHTQLYFRYCETRFGRFMHHHPSQPNTLKTRRAATIQAYKRVFYSKTCPWKYGDENNGVENEKSTSTHGNIQLAVESLDGTKIHFKCTKTTTFTQIKRVYGEKKGLDMDSFSFRDEYLLPFKFSYNSTVGDFVEQADAPYTIFAVVEQLGC
eukprot:m.66746 g.66746  ORF g.66746 m.66746 type:complete len:274 (-) comp11832_c1_seq1:134-955(-)